MLVVRENSEGEYVGQGGRHARGTQHEVATHIELFTYRGTERLVRHAFRRARQRLEERRSENRVRRFTHDNGGEREAEVCLVTKRNALPFWGDLYTEVFHSIAPEYPDVATHHELVDAACMKFVLCPWRFDVLAASNLHGDILTDLAAVLSGGMGVAPSMNINPHDRSAPPLFEPTHGSAPDIAGQRIADPRAMMLTTAQMLAWMGEEDLAAHTASTALRDAVAHDLRTAPQTPRGTDAVADAIVRTLSPRTVPPETPSPETDRAQP